MPGAKRIPGGSGSSNPTSKKFRNVAFKAASKKPNKASHLTSEALADHDDATSTSLTVNLSASVCVIEDQVLRDTFANVLRLWNSPQESDKEACAVLAAVTESIKAEGGKATPVAYWAALMSTLEQVTSRLLSLVFAKVGPVY